MTILVATSPDQTDLEEWHCPVVHVGDWRWVGAGRGVAPVQVEVSINAGVEQF